MTLKELLESNTGKLVARHGDVDLYRIDALPTDVGVPEKKKEVVLQLGEKTGHKHRLTVNDMENLLVYSWEGQLATLIEIKEDATLTHEEHNLITLKPGIYLRKQEREYNPFSKAVRKVVD
jgi:hypothetical protein